ncbi:MAG: hypothetical protein WD904_09705 [Dehalococcoidia bacterium]
MTLEAHTYETQTTRVWHTFARWWLERVDDLDAANARRGEDSQALAVVLPTWPRSIVGTLAYFGAAAGFLALLLLMKEWSLAAGLLLLPVYIFLFGLAVCVGTTRQTR